MYSQEERKEIYDRVCDLIADGKSLRGITGSAAGYDIPAESTILLWLQEDSAFSGQYARARERQADKYADEIIDIADDDKECPDRSRIRIDARKWKASKLAPKVYGDRLAHVGGDKNDNPIRQEVTLEADAFTRAITGLVARSGESGTTG